MILLLPNLECSLICSSGTILFGLKVPIRKALFTIKFSYVKNEILKKLKQSDLEWSIFFNV